MPWEVLLKRRCWWSLRVVNVSHFYDRFVLGRVLVRFVKRRFSDNPKTKMKYELKDFNRNIPDTDLLDDLKKVADKL